MGPSWAFGSSTSRGLARTFKNNPTAALSCLKKGATARETPALQIAGYAKAVVGVLEFRRDTGTRRAAGDFHVMPPRPSTRRFALPASWAARIPLGRTRVIIRIVPVTAPFVDIVTNVVNAEGVGSVARDRLRASLPARCIVRKRLRWFVAPGELFLFEAATCCLLPFGFCWQTVVAARVRAQPFAVSRRLKPGNPGNRLLRLAEIRVGPEPRRQCSSRAQEAFIFGIGDLSRGQEESVHQHTVHRTLAVLAGIRPHQEPAFRDANQGRFCG